MISPVMISIHPPRVGWDDYELGVTKFIPAISIHPPRVGWDQAKRVVVPAELIFQSTHPAWGGTISTSFRFQDNMISIHPPRVGWDVRSFTLESEAIISIHPPRVGWDNPLSIKMTPTILFQSTHPAWGGTLQLIMCLA